jgi:hypothetical protein
MEVRTDMRKLSFLLLVFCLGILFPTNANAWDVCETSVETLDVAGEIAFTSSVCNCLHVDIIILQITPTNPAVVMDSEVLTKATPHWQTNRSGGKQLPVDSYDRLRINVRQKSLYNKVLPFASVHRQSNLSPKGGDVATQYANSEKGGEDQKSQRN